MMDRFGPLSPRDKCDSSGYAGRFDCRSLMVSSRMATVSQLPDYDAALAWLYGRINYERSAIPAYRVQNFKLERMRDLMRRLGDPHVRLPVIHVAGTKGKGSTSTMLASMLTAAGYRAGLYTSPHLERTEERLVVDGQICAPQEFVELLNVVHPAVESMDEEGERCTGPGSPTYFEVMTASALVHFARRKVDAVVLEVGLGGRLDSTNIITPAVSVITSISFDHTRQLGNTLALIAGEKAGIIKAGIPVVTGVTEAEPLEVIERVAAENNAPLLKLGRDFSYTFEPRADLHSADKLLRGRVHYQGKQCLADLELGLIGEHQAANAAVALATLECLSTQGWKFDETALRRGLREARCPARIEVLRVQPTVVIDTAHNAASIAALLKELDASQDFVRRHLVFACSKDKDAEEMLRQLSPHFDSIVLTRFLNNPRSVPPEELYELAARVEAQAAGHSAQLLLAPTPVEAWQQALAIASREDLVCVTGSFFLAAELRSVIGVVPQRGSS
jgi:dihydrofolate synthase/folylpolyglutamate synthase